MTGRRPIPIEALPPLNEPLPKTLDCSELSEHDLLAFLSDATSEARALDVSKPSDRVKILVRLHPTGTIPDPGYRQARQRGVGIVTSIEANEDSARLAMRFIATQVLPYTERMLAVTASLRAMAGMWVNDSEQFDAAGGLPPFKDSTLIAERFLELLCALEPADQAAVHARIGGHPLVIAADPDMLRLWGDTRLIVGKNRVDDVFTYLLNDLPILERQIEEKTASLRHDLHLFMQRPSPILRRRDYLDALEQIIVAARQLTADDAETIRSIGARVLIADGRASVVGLSGSHRTVYIVPSAASQLLQFLPDQENTLTAQEPPP